MKLPRVRLEAQKRTLSFVEDLEMQRAQSVDVREGGSCDMKQMDVDANGCVRLLIFWFWPSFIVYFKMSFFYSIFYIENSPG